MASPPWLGGQVVGRTNGTRVASVAVVALLAGCAVNTSDAPSSSNSGVAASAETSVSSSGPNKTLRDYLAANKITETQVRPGEPGVPDIRLPVPPPGWTDAGTQTPTWAIGALVYTQIAEPQNPPTITVILSRLNGDADPAKVLEMAPGELRNLPDYQPLGEPASVSLDGKEAVQLSGTYSRDGVRRVIAQKTVAIPGPDGLYVLQINAEGREDDRPVLQGATAAIDQFTRIVP